MSQLTRNDLLKIPKAELHRHLEGAVRFSTLLDFAVQDKLDLPVNDIPKFKEALLVTTPMRDLASVLNKFWTTQSLLRTEERLERITYEACEDAFLEGIRILELRYSPAFVATNHSHYTFEGIHQAILRGMKRAQKDFPELRVGLIGIIGRIMPLKEASYAADFIIDNRASFIGIDLADSEDGFDCKPFAQFFMKAKKAGLHVTVHAGEANFEGATQSVRDAIEVLGAERIGHGVQIYKDPKMIDFVRQHKVALELCPTSNWLTNAVPSLKEHPFRRLMNEGVHVTLNSDDPGIFDFDLTNEFEVLARDHAFTADEFKRLYQNAEKVTFIK